MIIALILKKAKKGSKVFPFAVWFNPSIYVHGTYPSYNLLPKISLFSYSHFISPSIVRQGQFPTQDSSVCLLSLGIFAHAFLFCFAETVISANEVYLIAVVKPFKEIKVSDLSLLEWSKEMYKTQHEMNGNFLYTDQRYCS